MEQQSRLYLPSELYVEANNTMEDLIKDHSDLI